VKVRWVLALAGIAVVLAGLTVAAALRYLIPQLSQFGNPFDGTETQAEIDAYYQWIGSGYVFSELLPWLATATLLAGVAALALAARRAQLQLAGSASATASRVASSAASVSAGSAESIS
jgi:hypothetical protein